MSVPEKKSECRALSENATAAQGHEQGRRAGVGPEARLTLRYFEMR